MSTNHFELIQMSDSSLNVEFNPWEKLQVMKRLHMLFTDREAMVVLHTHFTLLYLRGGLCWDRGLACRRSTAIFTSENKWIQTLNTTVTCRPANAVHAKWEAASFLFRSKWKLRERIQIGKRKLDDGSKHRKPRRQICGMKRYSRLRPSYFHLLIQI